ncbi:MAG: CatB-related O-acetyltransferase [Vicingaceae bacterium]|nr:CatB-related O-acetyltransferase [Vicingaceae bacterium]
MKTLLSKITRKIITKALTIAFGKDAVIQKIIHYNDNYNLFFNANYFISSNKAENTALYSPYKIVNTNIGNYTYIAQNATINNTTIGKFCSIGPNFFCGWGLHPTNGISTHPMFYSTKKQNGITLSNVDKVEEIKPITIGNDVFIGMNVTVLDGITIGDGAVIGAGSVVSKNIPPYAIAVGSPIQIKKYRFNEEQIAQLKRIKWWDFSEEALKEVEKHFFSTDDFIEKQLKDAN